eukprot:TRINITY_DN4016_c0_g1_i1.p1 TRINITY_DN4016_c0_g1~~TRINITY_DN4016_c0_g1_i1.p1  ORF type:complete len:249 (+),score=27.62 TRINITY_DN4016_c0_g1_i1:80-826(+)
MEKTDQFPFFNLPVEIQRIVVGMLRKPELFAFKNVCDQTRRLVLNSNCLVFGQHLDISELKEDSALIVVIRLCRILRKPSFIRSLNLSNTVLGETGARHLASALKQNRSLTHINLRNCNLSKGLNSISTVLGNSLSLKKLDLSHNGFPLEQIWDQIVLDYIGADYNEQAQKAIAKLLKSTSLTDLNLSDCQIIWCVHLSDAIQHNRHLKRLDLRGNKFTKQDRLQIMRLLRGESNSEAAVELLLDITE